MIIVRLQKIENTTGRILVVNTFVIWKIGLGFVFRATRRWIYPANPIWYNRDITNYMAQVELSQEELQLIVGTIVHSIRAGGLSIGDVKLMSALFDRLDPLIVKKEEKTELTPPNN